MCNAEATLVYGLTVRAVDLLFAAHAWTRLEPTFRFFDLVFLRRRNGGLVTRDQGGGGERAMSRVPNEVWEEIRFHLAREETEISQDTVLGFLLCDNPKCESRPPAHRRYKYSDLWERCGDGSCDDCLQSLDEWIQNNVAYWDASHHATDESTIVDISFRGLPLDINHRFKRFIELFDLEVVDSSADSIFLRSDHQEAKKATKAKPGSDSDVPQGLRDRETTRIKPKWRLCVTSVCEW
ncbi:hypothetical protein JCM3766R1_007099 [Sporobolomyces carnicolor]